MQSSPMYVGALPARPTHIRQNHWALQRNTIVRPSSLEGGQWYDEEP